jgi:hypothetical protein
LLPAGGLRYPDFKPTPPSIIQLGGVVYFASIGAARYFGFPPPALLPMTA